MFKKANKVENGKYVSFKGITYALNLEKFKEVCTPKPLDYHPNEYEVSVVYDSNDEGETSVQSRVEHETKTAGNPQSDMIVYDIVKMLVVSLLENDSVASSYEPDLGTTLAINTLLSWGVLEEL